MFSRERTFVCLSLFAQAVVPVRGLFNDCCSGFISFRCESLLNFLRAVALCFSCGWPPSLMLPWFVRQPKYRSVLVIGLDNAGKTSILCHLANVAKANKGVVDRVETAPTIGVQMVEFRRRNVHWVAWDMSGQDRCNRDFKIIPLLPTESNESRLSGFIRFYLERPSFTSDVFRSIRDKRRYRDLWTLHASRVNGVIFVVDVTDGARMGVAREELYEILASKALRRSSAPIAILANKYDVVTSSSTGTYTPSHVHCVTLANVCVAMGLDDIQAQCPARVFATSAFTRQGIEDAMDWLSLHTNTR